MCACSAPAEAFDVVQNAVGTPAAIAAVFTGVLIVDDSVVVPAVSVVLAAVKSVPVPPVRPSDHPPAQVAIVVVTRAVALITIERAGIFTDPRLVVGAPVLSVTMPGSIFHHTIPPLFRAASLIASWIP